MIKVSLKVIPFFLFIQILTLEIDYPDNVFSDDFFHNKFDQTKSGQVAPWAIISQFIMPDFCLYTALDVNGVHFAAYYFLDTKQYQATKANQENFCLGVFTQIDKKGSKQLYDRLVQVYAQERAQQEKKLKIAQFCDSQ